MKIDILQNIPNRALIIAYPDTDTKLHRRTRNKAKMVNKPTAPRSRMAAEYLKAVENMKCEIPKEFFKASGVYLPMDHERSYRVYMNGVFMGTIDSNGFKPREDV
jgi:hypothetical protein